MHMQIFYKNSLNPFNQLNVCQLSHKRDGIGEKINRLIWRKKSTILSLKSNSRFEYSNDEKFRGTNSKKREKLNIYEWYIEHLKKKKLVEGVSYHKHHILPKHDGGPKDGPIVVCTPQEHARAHYLRYLVYKQPLDLAAYKGMKGKTQELVALINEKRIATSKARKVLMWNREFQVKQSKKKKNSYYLRENPNEAKKFAQMGGVISGLIWTEKKRESSRKKGKILGKKFGRVGGLKKQSSKTKARLQKQLGWKHKPTGSKFVSQGIAAVSDMVDLLNQVVPGSLKFKNALSPVLRGVEPSRGGWFIEWEKDVSENSVEESLTPVFDLDGISESSIEIDEAEIREYIKSSEKKDLEEE